MHGQESFIRKRFKSKLLIESGISQVCFRRTSRLKVKPHMCRLTYAVIALFLFVILAPVAGGSPTEPRIQFDGRSHDFGRVGHVLLKEEFEFSNAGDAPLMILQVKSSCGCTAVLVSDRKLAPGDRGIIRAVVDPSRYTGAFAAHVDVYTDDPIEPVVRLRLSAEVFPDVWAEPMQVYFGQVRTWEGIPTDSFTLHGAVFDRIRLQPSHPWIKATLLHRPGKAESSTAEVEVILSQDLPAGRLHGEVKVEVEGYANPLTVPVVGYVEEDIAVSPHVLAFGEIRPGQMVSRVIRVARQSGDRLAVRDVVSDLGFVSARVEPVDSDRGYHVIVDVAPDLPHGRFTGQVVIKTDSVRQPVLKIPVFGYGVD